MTLLVAMASIQMGAALAKQLFPVVGPIAATTLRLFFATLVLFCIWRPWRGKLNRRDAIAISLYGVSLGLMNLLFYLALDRIPLGIAVALEFIGPLSVALLASRRYWDLFWVLLAIAGIYLVMPLQQASGNLDPLGVFLALGAGVCWAAYIIFGQKAGSSLGGGRVTALGMFVAALIVLPVGMVYGELGSIDMDIMPFALAVAILSSALPYSLEMISLKRLPAKTFGILMSIEPALAALSGMMFLGETLSPMQWLAVTCIIAASLGSSLSFAREVRVPVDAKLDRC